VPVKKPSEHLSKLNGFASRRWSKPNAPSAKHAERQLPSAKDGRKKMRRDGVADVAAAEDHGNDPVSPDNHLSHLR
jgi:hypothetical protein